VTGMAVSVMDYKIVLKEGKQQCYGIEVHLPCSYYIWKKMIYQKHSLLAWQTYPYMLLNHMPVSNLGIGLLFLR
jgi:hypothetical protein